MTATDIRHPLHSNLAHAHAVKSPVSNERGPFDIVGDVHGCLLELLELMAALGYQVERQADEFSVTPPAGRKLAFVGDLVDRGPDTPEVLRLAMSMARAGQAFCVAGNRDMEFLRALKGRDVKVTYGLARSLEQLADQPEEFRTEAAEFLYGLASHYVFDDGKLVVVHAGLKEAMQGRTSAEAREFALHGETSGERDHFGLPFRLNWAADYRGMALVVYGHRFVAEPKWINNTVNIDTGCVYGGHLTALRYPEMKTVSVPAKAIYFKPRRPFTANAALTRKAEKS